MSGENEKSYVIVSTEGSGMGEDLDHSLAYKSKYNIEHRVATHWKHGQCKLLPSVPWCVVEVQPCPLQTDNVVVRNQATGI